MLLELVGLGSKDRGTEFPDLLDDTNPITVSKNKSTPKIFALGICGFETSRCDKNVVGQHMCCTF